LTAFSPERDMHAYMHWENIRQGRAGLWQVCDACNARIIHSRQAGMSACAWALRRECLALSHELIHTQQTINATRLGARTNDPYYCYQIKPTYSSTRCNCNLQAIDYSKADASDMTNSQNWINQPTLYNSLLKLGQAKRIGKKTLVWLHTNPSQSTWVGRDWGGT
jgi:hypothetical protein